MNAGKVRRRLEDAPTEEMQLLLSQTKRTLDRHAEIEQSQRRQAIRILQAYVASAGVLLGLFPFIGRFFETIPFAANPGPIRVLFGGGLTLIGFFTISGIPGLLYDIPTPCSEILSPDAIRSGPVSGLLEYLGLKSVDPVEARAGIRSVTHAHDLEEDILNGCGGDVDAELLISRLDRIDQNESVIDYNTKRLQTVYQQIAWAIELLAIGGFFFLFGLVVLVAQAH